MVQCRLLSAEEFTEIEDRRRAEYTLKPGGGLMKDFLLPGMMWFCPWLFDPNSEDDSEEGRRERNLAAAESGSYNGMLSIHYWRDWSRIRPPICVVCPGGSHWVVDQKSRNGDGWRVTGEAPKLTCEPSIVVPNYHGYLRDGVFTPPLP